MRSKSTLLEEWNKALSNCDKPAYMAIAETIELEIQQGILKLDDRLPPIRELAKGLDLDYTTVARAYQEAQHRGLITSKAGVGSYVRIRNSNQLEAEPTLIEMTMNMAPEPQEQEILARMRHGARHVTEQGNFHRLTRYQDFGGSEEDQLAASTWLNGISPHHQGRTVLVTPGIQATLAGLMTALVGAGNTLCAETITYPGVKAMAGLLGIRTLGIPSDGEGILPDALEAHCRVNKVRALYLNPTIQNPTTRTISETRRHELVEVARHFGLKIIEDDPYSKLMRTPPPSLASLAPELTYYINGLSKTCSAGLRIAFLVCPTELESKRIASSLRATQIMASPMCTALATQWILDGTAQMCLDSIRMMSQRRQLIAKRILGDFKIETNSEGFHLWLNLPSVWNQSAFCGRLLNRGIAIASADMFCLEGSTPNAVRLSLGGNLSDERIEQTLRIVAETLNSYPPSSAQQQNKFTARDH
ncbi:PLP-dependent aminotransferase family protein [Limnobacter alexandrii]|jgi:DNA-binding transcriptional MocR family regulator|uniref:aminotransferase-like domain-containing protein n=1 Tax=Limnobacter alexandrii TaxID=2570352 RepID=UPI0011080293|nr:PLP-dependent aminotransferase family protein [Limnobacter alexandrii]